MVKSLHSSELAALADPDALVVRWLMWITAKTRDTSEAVSTGFWNDVGIAAFNVIDALTGSTVSRTFYGSGSLITIGDLVQSADLTVNTVTIDMSGIDDRVEQVLRGYDPRLAPVQIYRLLLNKDTMAPVYAARPVFVGMVDLAPITTPAAGGEGRVGLTLVSQIAELTRTNPAMRSHDSQLARASGDDFYKRVPQMPKRTIFWGREKGKV
jgi:hypothetical protein